MSGTSYEKTRFKDRVRELITLVLFITASLIASVILMDILIFPLALFSINNKGMFNYFIKHATWISLLLIMIYLIVRKAYELKKGGMHTTAIIKHMALRPFKALSVIGVFLMIIFLLVYIVYFLMSSNYYLLYKIINM